MEVANSTAASPLRQSTSVSEPLSSPVNESSKAPEAVSTPSETVVTISDAAKALYAASGTSLAIGGPDDDGAISPMNTGLLPPPPPPPPEPEPPVLSGG